MKQTFDILIRTEAPGIPTILQVIEGAATLLSIVPTPKDAPAVPTMHSRPGNVTRHRPFGIRGEDLAMKIFSDGKEHHLPEFMKVYEEAGLQPHSASPLLSHLRKEGKIKRNANGMYQLVTT